MEDDFKAQFAHHKQQIVELWKHWTEKMQREQEAKEKAEREVKEKAEWEAWEQYKWDLEFQEKTTKEERQRHEEFVGESLYIDRICWHGKLKTKNIYKKVLKSPKNSFSFLSACNLVRDNF